MTSMDEGACAWLVTVCADHFWRVPHWYEFDDLLCDGLECWYRVVAHYETKPKRVRNRAHLMRLFKTTFLNHIHKLSKQKTRNRVEVLVGDVVPDQPYTRHDDHDVWDRISRPRDIGEYNRVVAEAPEFLKPLLRALLVDAPAPYLRALYRRRGNGTRETLNERLCKIAGYDPTEIDLVGELRMFLRTR